uniref:Uncharacterized protein n=1 Tax=Romanomermis culicivorax TaxID=13658 RepID=A0A915I6V6_ROMCU
MNALFYVVNEDNYRFSLILYSKSKPRSDIYLAKTLSPSKYIKQKTMNSIIINLFTVTLFVNFSVGFQLTNWDDFWQKWRDEIRHDRSSTSSETANDVSLKENKNEEPVPPPYATATGESKRKKDFLGRIDPERLELIALLNRIG